MKERKTQYIIFRVTPTEKAQLIEEAGGKSKLSKLVRAKLNLKK